MPVRSEVDRDRFAQKLLILSQEPTAPAVVDPNDAVLVRGRDLASVAGKTDRVGPREGRGKFESLLARRQIDHLDRTAHGRDCERLTVRRKGCWPRIWRDPKPHVRFAG